MTKIEIIKDGNVWFLIHSEGVESYNDLHDGEIPYNLQSDLNYLFKKDNEENDDE